MRGACEVWLGRGRDKIKGLRSAVRAFKEVREGRGLVWFIEMENLACLERQTWELSIIVTDAGIHLPEMWSLKPGSLGKVTVSNSLQPLKLSYDQFRRQVHVPLIRLEEILETLSNTLRRGLQCLPKICPLLASLRDTAGRTPRVSRW